MALRLRLVDDTWVAICAARSVEKEGDVYLDDGQHHAVCANAHRAQYEMYGTKLAHWDEHAAIADQEESNNPSREWWDKTYK